MERPDEELFSKHIAHFQRVDSFLGDFCNEFGFTVDKNLHRKPGRVLRKRGNPELVSDFYQEGSWLDLEPQCDLPHTLAVAGYYEPPADIKHLCKLEFVLAEHRTFDDIVANLREYLQNALNTLNSWSLSTFELEGTRIENLRGKSA